MNRRWRQKNLFLILVIVLSLGLFGCGSSEKIGNGEEEEQDTLSDNIKQVGEPAYLSNDDGGEMTLIITKWGTDRAMLTFDKLLCIEYEMENTGETDITIGNSLFDIYADDYKVEQSYFEDEANMITTVAPGRKVSGKIYGVVDADNVSNIELQIGDITIAIKGNKVTQEGFNNQLLKPDEVNFASASEELIEGISGRYTDSLDSSNTIDINMYSVPEGNVVGTASVADGTYEGELIEIKTNVYQLLYEDVTPIVVSFSKGRFESAINAYAYYGGYKIASGKKDVS